MYNNQNVVNEEQLSLVFYFVSDAICRGNLDHFFGTSANTDAEISLSAIF
jgi:hypothetical protein